MQTTHVPIRVAIIGGNRGLSFNKDASSLSDLICATAICDINETVLAPWRARGDMKCYDNYDQVLNDDAIDAVCIATPIGFHTQQAIAALRAGKHVLCEVTAAQTLEDCRALVTAARKSNRTYMMAENYCFTRDALMIEEMVNRGVFGDLITAEGSYLHDCHELAFHPDGSPTWRQQFYTNPIGNCYPTHSIGPVSRWLGINRTDRYLTTASWQTGSKASVAYAQHNYGKDSQQGRPEKWNAPDSVATLLRTANQVLVYSRVDVSSPRPHHLNRYALQGTHASYTSNIQSDKEPLIWIKGRSETSKTGQAHNWEPLYKYASEFEHPLWREFGSQAIETGHWGADYFVMREFALAVRDQRPPMIDVYDAVTWSAITPLSALSIKQGNASLPMPDFKTDSC